MSITRIILIWGLFVKFSREEFKKKSVLLIYQEKREAWGEWEMRILLTARKSTLRPRPCQGLVLSGAATAKCQLIPRTEPVMAVMKK